MNKIKVIGIMTREEFQKEAFANKEKYIGKMVIDKFARKYIIINITEKGMQVFPLNQILAAG